MTRRSTPPLALAALVLILAVAGCGARSADPPAQAADTAPAFATATAAHLTLTGGWIAATGDMAGMSDMPGMDMSSMPGMDTESTAYATLTDTGASADALVSVSTPAAAQATLHNTVSSSDGTAGTMVDTADVPVPAHGEVTLAPGGYHVMLTGLRTDLEAGSTVTMTWTFRSGAALTATFPVIDPTDRPDTGR